MLEGRGGALFLDTATYEQLSDHRTIRVAGARFLAMNYTVNWRARESTAITVSSGEASETRYLSLISMILFSVKALIKTKVLYDFDFNFHIHGRNCTIGRLEPSTCHTPTELAIRCQAWAET